MNNDLTLIDDHRNLRRKYELDTRMGYFILTTLIKKLINQKKK